MNNHEKLEFLRELTKIAIAPPTGQRPGPQGETEVKPKVQINQEVVANNTLPVANRKISVHAPVAKNTALAKGRKPKITTGKFGTGMAKVGKAESKELLKLRMQEKIKEANLLSWGGQAVSKIPQAWRWGKNLLGFGKKVAPKAPDAMNKATPFKSFVQGAKETAKPFTSGQVQRETAKATREAVKQTRQAADEIQGAAGQTPKLFGNKVPTNANMPMKYYTQTTTMPGGQATLSSGKKILLPGEKVVRGPGQHLKSKTIRNMDAKSKLTMNTGQQKQLARQAYKRNQRNTRINELSATLGRGVGHVARHGTRTTAQLGAAGGVMGLGMGAYKGLGVKDTLKAGGNMALDGTGIPAAVDLVRGKPLRSLGNESIERSIANLPAKVDDAAKRRSGGDAELANRQARKAGSDNYYDKDIRPLKGTAKADAKEAHRLKIQERLTKKLMGEQAYNNQRNLDRATGVGQ